MTFNLRNDRNLVTGRMLRHRSASWSLLVLCLSVLIGGVAAFAAEPGETVYYFLDIGPDARAEGMAGTGTGIADGLGAIYYNPAALASAVPGQVVASYINWVTDIQSGHLAMAWRLGENGRMAATVQYLDFGSLQGFNSAGSPTDAFAASDFALALHAAGSLSSRVAWGVGGKFITESIDGDASSAMAFDGGLLFKFADRRTRAGLAVRNAGIQTSSIGGGDKESLPATASLGFSHELRGTPVLVAADLVQPFYEELGVAAGLEYAAFDQLTLRAGYNSVAGRINTDSNKDDLAGLTFGLGFVLNRIQIDYAYGSLSALGTVHRFTLRSGI